MSIKKIFPLPLVAKSQIPGAPEARYVCQARIGGRIRYYVIPQINDPKSPTELCDPNRKLLSLLPHIPQVPPQIPPSALPGSDQQLPLLKLETYANPLYIGVKSFLFYRYDWENGVSYRANTSDATVERLEKFRLAQKSEDGYYLFWEKRLLDLTPQALADTLNLLRFSPELASETLRALDEARSPLRYFSDDFVQMDMPWFRPPQNRFLRLIDIRSRWTALNVWWNRAFSRHGFSALYDYFPGTVYKMEIVPGQIKIERNGQTETYYKLKVDSLVPTTYPFHFPPGWLPRDYSLEIQARFRLSDLAGHGRIVTAEHPDLPFRLWAPSAAQLPEQVDPQTIRAEKNAALCNVHLLASDAAGETTVLEPSYPVLVISHPPKWLLRPDIMRSVIEIAPAGDGFEVVRGRPNPKNNTLPIPVTEYNYVGQKSLVDLAWEQRIVFDPDALVNEPTVVIEELKAPGWFGTGKFQVRVKLSAEESFTIPGEYFRDKDDNKPLLGNRNRDLYRLSDIFQHADGLYSEAANPYRPKLFTREGVPGLALTRVERVKYRDPEAGRQLAKILDFFREKLAVTDKTLVGVAGMTAAAPTAAVQLNRRFWVPLNLTNRFLDRHLTEVAPLNDFYYFLEVEEEQRAALRQLIRARGTVINNRPRLPVQIKKTETGEYRVVNKDEHIDLSGNLFRYQDNLDHRLLETPNLWDVAEDLSSFDAFLYLEYQAVKLKIEEKTS